ncbi:dihydroxyacetone kinase family protein [Saxibacter everestensis]|uniref:Dihydroxyacetone kinase family protein n=1 Tax=Saxibacter everestensis TaxID=2909229 RepID=A0ABY8QQW7_9MICO|nr:dihydroxyacetone kinase family protein [Brevibacteriaceae bacterium ZFBP1038]
MTKIFNQPSEFAEDQLTGFLDLYADRLRGVPGGVIARRAGEPQVAVVIGGGSGHYPAFAGLVGEGFASGAVVGNIFTSPSATQVYSVAKAANQGRGVILSFGNYAGDTMNFGLAADRLRKEGIDTRIVLVTDDIASADAEDQRRGIAGDFAVFKVMGAAAGEGRSLDQVERLGQAANSATRTLGVAFDGCTMPGASEPLFTVPQGHLGLGLGIHGEPGIRDEPMPSAEDLSHVLVSSVLEHAPTGGSVGESRRVAAILNGLGTTKYEELFLLWGTIAPRLREAGFQPVEAEVGELVTSLDMGGCSLTLMWLDDELERLWCADAYTPAYRKQRSPIAAISADADDFWEPGAEQDVAPQASPAAQRLAGLVRDALGLIATVLQDNEKLLGDIDAVAGDGDHGRGMVKGANAAVEAVELALSNGSPGTASHAADGGSPGASWLLKKAGQAWAERAGGTSGVLWGAAFEAFGASLGDDSERYQPKDAVAAAQAFATAIVELGGATVGDKTLVDALLPFVDELTARVNGGEDLLTAFRHAAALASERAEATSELTPKLGRARPLAEKSLGTPDAGATSMALVLSSLADAELWKGKSWMLEA